MKVVEFDTEGLHKLFYINPESLTGLSYKVDRHSGTGRVMARKGAPAGGRKPSKSHGYFTVSLEGSPRLVHRVIYTLAFGSIPEGAFVDHKNGIRTDNRLDNLRLVTRALNQRNQKMSSRNKTGFVGVSLVSRDNSPYYAAHWRDISGKTKTKIFTINKYGDALAFSLAVEYRKKMLEELNELGAGYTNRHIQGES